MRYSIRHLLAVLVAAGTLTALTLLGLLHCLIPYLRGPLHSVPAAQAVQAFFFERTAIQWCTICVFYFAIVMLAERAMAQSALDKDLANTTFCPEPQVGRGPEDLSWVVNDWAPPQAEAASAEPLPLVAGRLAAVRGVLSRDGRLAGASEARELARQAEQDVQQVHSLLGSAVRVMLALGFFGTVWGISRSLFGAFSQLGQGASSDKLQAGLKDLTQALSAALDTTVLALMCGILASVAVTVVRWGEVNSLRRLAELVRRRFDLPIGPAQACEQGHLLARELSAVGTHAGQQLQDLGGHAMECFQQTIATVAEGQLAGIRENADAIHAQMRERAEAISTASAEQSRQQGEALQAALSEVLDEFARSIRQPKQAFDAELLQAGGRLQEQGQAIHACVASGPARIEEALGVPAELSIHYPRTRKDLDPQAPPAPPDSAEPLLAPADSYDEGER